MVCVQCDLTCVEMDRWVSLISTAVAAIANGCEFDPRTHLPISLQVGSDKRLTIKKHK